MRDWQAYWHQRPRQFEATSFRRQVDRTIEREPQSDAEISLVAGEAMRTLGLEPSDHLLDLCCGNGLITSVFAETCASVTGVDYSDGLIEIAREHFARENVHYCLSSVLDLTTELFPDGTRFSKVVMVESLQYFEVSQLPRLLDAVGSVSTQGVRIVFTGVPDQDRIGSFYDTPERQAEYQERKIEGREALGYWWRSEDIVRVAESRDMGCQILPQDPALNTAHYRFDVRLGAF